MKLNLTFWLIQTKPEFEKASLIQKLFVVFFETLENIGQLKKCPQFQKLVNFIKIT